MTPNQQTTLDAITAYAAEHDDWFIAADVFGRRTAKTRKHQGAINALWQSGELVKHVQVKYVTRHNSLRFRRLA